MLNKFLWEEDFGFDIWDEMKKTIKCLPDLLVRLVRSFHPLYNAYISMGLKKDSAYPVEEALKWQFGALKVVVYHTEYLSSEEGEDQASRYSRFHGKSITESKWLYFGGDWTDHSKVDTLDIINTTKYQNIDGEEDKDDGPSVLSCKHYAKRNYVMENMPDGPADPFFCFGGEQNIPDMLVLLGKYQEAMDFICHWTNNVVDSDEPYVQGSLVSHLEKWNTMTYKSIDIYRAVSHEDILEDWDLFRGNFESRVLLRIFGILTLIRLHVITKSPELKEKRKEQFYTFMQGTHPRLGGSSPALALRAQSPVVKLIYKHVLNDTHEPVERNTKVLYDLLRVMMVDLTLNTFYYMSGDPSTISQPPWMDKCCQVDPQNEIGRLVWKLFHILPYEEQEMLTILYIKAKGSYFHNIKSGFTDNEESDSDKNSNDWVTDNEESDSDRNSNDWGDSDVDYDDEISLD